MGTSWIGRTATFSAYSPHSCNLSSLKHRIVILAFCSSQTSNPWMPNRCSLFQPKSQDPLWFYSFSYSQPLFSLFCSPSALVNCFQFFLINHTILPSPLAHIILPPASFFSSGSVVQRIIHLLTLVWILPPPRSLPRAPRHSEASFFVVLWYFGIMV